jgi:hypothetical protein
MDDLRLIDTYDLVARFNRNNTKTFEGMLLILPGKSSFRVDVFSFEDDTSYLIDFSDTRDLQEQLNEMEENYDFFKKKTELEELYWESYVEEVDS